MNAKMKTAIWMVLSFSTFETIAQTTDWKLEDGKALAETRVVIKQSQDEIYKSINRWLISYFHNPEEHLKAKVHGEYLRGVAHVSEFFTSGRYNSADLQYTFIFEIKNDAVLFQITDALIIYGGSQDADVDQGAVHKAEEFFIRVESAKKKKSNSDSESVITALNNFSTSIFQSFENSILAKK